MARRPRMLKQELLDAFVSRQPTFEALGRALHAHLQEVLERGGVKRRSQPPRQDARQPGRKAGPPGQDLPAPGRHHGPGGPARHHLLRGLHRAGGPADRGALPRRHRPLGGQAAAPGPAQLRLPLAALHLPPARARCWRSTPTGTGPSRSRSAPSSSTPGPRSNMTSATSLPSPCPCPSSGASRGWRACWRSPTTSSSSCALHASLREGHAPARPARAGHRGAGRACRCSPWRRANPVSELDVALAARLGKPVEPTLFFPEYVIAHAAHGAAGPARSHPPEPGDVQPADALLRRALLPLHHRGLEFRRRAPREREAAATAWCCSRTGRPCARRSWSSTAWSE